MLTLDQKNILRAISLENSDIYEAQTQIAALSDAEAIAKINAWLPGAKARYENKLASEQAQITFFTKRANFVIAVLNSIDEII